jgi:hypothetical protein
MPQIDTTILLPSMPVITAPTLGSSFYTPGEIYRGPSRSSSKTRTSSQSAQTSAQTSSQTVSQSSASAAAAGTSSPANPVQPSVNAAVLQQLASGGGLASGGAVTASDLTSFDSAGLLGSFYSMLGGSPAQQSSSVSASSQDKLLTEILSELSDLKKQNGSASSSQTSSSAETSAVRTDISQPAILRFTVNGHDIRPSCRTVYFSDRESDGTFMLTGDRRYTADGRTRSETFYLLFKSLGSSGSCMQYSVQPALVQDSTNVNSYLYKLSQKNTVTAVKTGNLVTMRISDPSYSLDLLLDTGTASARAGNR